ncbi:hypothetical protein K458DRAFT_422036 [Lentithecium fluviatile CBS 122367]|uniref:Secreted protein n=1 Tax=Lentithecium fluviatile CBS 122367 TaxID=1168545 RepID=A0A6G1INJ2_9PLEO|nr:hypothetical protein K458DRAFT_422036 [Lentithecium fluviatile CBS 122367]
MGKWALLMLMLMLMARVCEDGWVDGWTGGVYQVLMVLCCAYAYVVGMECCGTPRLTSKLLRNGKVDDPRLRVVPGDAMVGIWR